MKCAPSSFDDVSESLGSELEILAAPAAPTRARDRASSADAALPELMKIADVAKQLIVSERTVRRWEKEDLLPGARFGRTLRFRVEDVRRFLDKRLTKRVLGGFAASKLPVLTQSHN